MIDDWRAGIRRVFRLDVWREDVVQRDADDELESILQARIDECIAAGMSPDEANAEALRRIGGSVGAARSGLRRSAAQRERIINHREWFADIGADVRFALRGLRREPLFACFGVITLALGIGANAAMFGIVDKLLLRGPAHVREPNRVVRLFWTSQMPSGAEHTVASFDTHVYPNIQSEVRAFSGLAMYTVAYRGTRVGTGNDARLVSSASATANFMSVLGAQPELGRFFTIEEQETSPPVVVLGNEFWKTEFGGDGRVVGSSVTLSDRQYTVVGVAPAGFTGAELERVDAWFPLRVPLNAAARHWGRGHSSGPRTVGRLNAGITFADASTDATNAHRRTYDGDERAFADGRLFVGPLHYGPDGNESTEASISRWLVGMSVAVLLIACANIASLLLARAVRQRRELAVRLALGAGRSRLARLLLSQALLLSVLGGAGAIVVAFVTGRAVRRVLLPDVDWTSGPVDARVLVFSMLLTLLVGVAIGLLPAWRAGRSDVFAALKAGARDGGGRSAVLRRALLLAQTALAMLLLIGAGAFVRSLQRVRHLDLGVQADRVVLISPGWSRTGATPGSAAFDAEQQRRSDFARTVIDRLSSLPEVEHAASTIGLPFGNSGSVTMRVPGRDSLPRLQGDFNHDPDISAVSADYFATVGTRLIQGRVFTTADRAGTEPVAIVSAAMASALWPGRSPLGECIQVGGAAASCSRIVGVVQDARRNQIAEDLSMHYYVPLGQEVGISGPQIVVRPRGNAAAAVPALRAAVHELDRTIRNVDATVLAERVEPQTRSWRLGAMTFALFAILALVVAAVGVFGVVACLVEQRRHEIAVRIAVGARYAHVVWLLLRGAVGTTLVGILLGAGLALAGRGFAEPLLFETTIADPTIVAAVGIILLSVACAASLHPALRARRIDPVLALRDD